MSKIEKALKKAQTVRNSGMVPQNKEVASVPSRISDASALAVKKTQAKSLIKNMGDEGVLSFEELVQRRIIHPGMDDAGAANSYRALRTKLLQKSKGENFSLLITSCVKGYDSSYLALNISAAFSLDDSKTSLVVDCNVSDPRIDKMLGINTDSGLTDYIEDQEISVENIIYSAGIKRLRVIPAGSTDEKRSEYFTSSRMRDLLDGLIDRYPDRYVFVDAPSVSSSADTKILADLCDFVIVVVPYARVTQNQILNCVKAIEPEKLLGVVMNDMP